uniref:RBR-type E3 ubiquitin transferase n=1 Tax=Schistosoma japonicum TaxID=6182 RepID=C1LEF3_SCHJA|nr:ariadne 2 [Schistosoma japonicum]
MEETNNDQSYDSDESDDYNYNEPEYDVENEKFCSDRLHPESFLYKALERNEVESFLNSIVDTLCNLINVPPAIARLLLHNNKWDVEAIKKKFLAHPLVTLINHNILPGSNIQPTCSDSQAVMATIYTVQNLNFRVIPFMSPPKVTPDSCCEICYTVPSNKTDNPVSIFNESDLQLLHMSTSSKKGNSKDCTLSLSSVTSYPPTTTAIDNTIFDVWSDNPHDMNSDFLSSNEMSGLCGLSCGHRFCPDCWCSYLTIKIEEGLSIEINCMSVGCNVLVIEDFLLTLLKNSPVKDKYLNLLFHRTVESHPSLRFCIGLGCPVLICALEEPKARRVQCERCHAEFCFMCSEAYHAPTSCATLKQWLVKCRDDSGTANYMTAHTKDCPSCHVCIEKNEGCNHMKCSLCHYEFCWVCLGIWKSHDAEYYFCSKYQENPDAAKESVRTRARESLERYMFYYERWENHERSLRLEHDQRARIQARINEKVLKKEGTWIDWQYLLLAADTLRNCRYTLKYTYPHAFYGEKLERKELFEYQQALLEAEVEDLSWKIEHAEITDRGDLQNKMDICEKHRLTLLQEFLTN